MPLDSQTTMPVVPIKPDEVPSHKVKIFPDKVICAWNNIITKNYRNGRATVLQSEAISEICKLLNCKSKKVFAEGWLDIEDLYRQYGWKVTYDKPGYNETYEANFTFEKA